MPGRSHASGSTTGLPGRFVMGARTAHIVADASIASGGLGEALVAQELFLVSLATCALAVIDKEARAQRLPADVRVDVQSEIDPEDSTRYSKVTMAFRFEGVERGRALALVAAFTAVCPIYNTLRRSSPVEISVDDGALTAARA